MNRTTAATVASTVVIGLVALTVIVPFLHEIAKSLSYPTVVDQGVVGFWPKSFTLGNYEYYLRKQLAPLLTALKNTAFLVLVGGGLSVIGITLLAFPVSRSRSEFRLGGLLIYSLVFFMIFQRPLIPLRLTMQGLGMLDSLWAVVFNMLITPFLVIMTITFFRRLPDEIFESARIDGANDLQAFGLIALPLSRAVLVTVFLFEAVGFWNVFLQARLFLISSDLYPIQLFIHSIMQGGGDVLAGDMNVQDPFAERESIKSALTVMSAIPLSVLYVSLQKYFTRGMLAGSVKG